jgi:hypothetical protein
MVKLSFGAFLFSMMISNAVFAAPHYQVNMRVGMNGLSPFSINTTAKPGKKSFISQFSDDGQVETLVEVYTKQSQVNKKEGLFLEVAVSKRVRGQLKATERTQIFAPENEETETGMNSKGKMAGNLSLAVMAHQL